MNKVFKIKGESYRVIREYCDSYLAISEVGFNLKMLPRLIIIK